MKVKELGSLVGLIISFRLAVGRSARFYTRFSTIEVARVAEEKGWSTCLVLTEEVLSELRFWKENLRKLNGQKIRREAGVQVVHPRVLYSNAGGNMAGGCMIVNKKVCEAPCSRSTCRRRRPSRVPPTGSSGGSKRA
mgnify:CR=1 FL=1